MIGLLPESPAKERTFRIPFTLTPSQQHINDNAKRFTFIRAARKFGKTRYTLRKILDWMGPPDSKIWYIAPTYRQGRLISWSDIKRLFPQEVYAKKPNDSDMMITLKNGSELFYMGSDDPDSLRGPDPTGVIFDEAAYHKAEAWYNVVEPNLAVHKAPAIFVSTPRGFNWFKDLEDEAKRLIERGDQEWSVFHYTIYDNPHIDPKEIERIRESVDPMVWRQEYMAEYESSVGRVFNVFQDTERHTRRMALSANFEAYRGIDWGMRDDTGCVWGTLLGNLLYIYREHAEHGLSPASQANIILGKTPTNENIVGNVISHDAVREDLEMKGLTVLWHMQNTGIRPLQASSRNKSQSRSHLQDLFQQDRIVISPDCRKLRKELLEYEWKDTAMEKTEDGNDNLVDALHYLVERLQGKLFLSDKSHEKTMDEIWEEARKQLAERKVKKFPVEFHTSLSEFKFEDTVAGYL